MGPGFKRDNHHYIKTGSVNETTVQYDNYLSFNRREKTYMLNARKFIEYKIAADAVNTPRLLNFLRMKTLLP